MSLKRQEKNLAFFGLTKSNIDGNIKSVTFPIYYGRFLHMGRSYGVYIMANKWNTVLYTGVTANLWWRTYEHKHKLVKGFTSRYNVDKLVYYEEYGYIGDAIRREKQIKGGSRQKKINLINSVNPKWGDLSEGWYDA